MPVFATATAAFTSCCVVKVGATARTGHAASANWTCNCATKRPGAGSRASCAMSASRARSNETWAMNFVHCHWATLASLACSPSSLSSPASCRRFSRGSPSAAPTSWRSWKGPATRWAPRRQIRVHQSSEFVSRGLNLWAYPARPSHSTSRGLASRPTMRLSNPSTAASGPNASTPIGFSAFRMPTSKSGKPLRAIGNRSPTLRQTHTVQLARQCNSNAHTLVRGDPNFGLAADWLKRAECADGSGDQRLLSCR